jgi:hypothetical protein
MCGEDAPETGAESKRGRRAESNWKAKGWE